MIKKNQLLRILVMTTKVNNLNYNKNSDNSLSSNM